MYSVQDAFSLKRLLNLQRQGLVARVKYLRAKLVVLIS